MPGGSGHLAPERRNSGTRRRCSQTWRPPLVLALWPQSLAQEGSGQAHDGSPSRPETVARGLEQPCDAELLQDVLGAACRYHWNRSWSSDSERLLRNSRSLAVVGGWYTCPRGCARHSSHRSVLGEERLHASSRSKASLRRAKNLSTRGSCVNAAVALPQRSASATIRCQQRRADCCARWRSGHIRQGREVRTPPFPRPRCC